MKTKTLFFLLAISLFSCNEEIEVDPDSGFEIFTINQGNHTSISRNEPFSGIGINITAIFDESAEYTLEVANDQADINKLVGFSDCAQNHQSESARIGWRWYEGELQILAYTYTEGRLSFELMGAIPINREVDMSIRITQNTYEFSGENLTSVSMPRTSACDAGENYWLWPYFGGDQTAPQDITIRLKRETLE